MLRHSQCGRCEEDLAPVASFRTIFTCSALTLFDLLLHATVPKNYAISLPSSIYRYPEMDVKLFILEHDKITSVAKVLSNFQKM